MKWIDALWKEIGSSAMYNCWQNTGIMAHGALPERSRPLTRRSDVEPIEQEVSCLISSVVPEYRQVPINELLSSKKDEYCKDGRGDE